jgi:hypothetical protein
MERIVSEAVVAYFKVLYRNLNSLREIMRESECKFSGPPGYEIGSVNHQNTTFGKREAERKDKE